jgi:hypothetical protein
MPKLMITEEIRQNLGQAGLEEVAGNLWPNDCQTCGRPLGKEPPALWIEARPPITIATLNHSASRPPTWNDSGPLLVIAGHSTWMTQIALIPLKGPGGIREMPSFLLNPSLESVNLDHDQETGRWRVSPSSYFTRSGLRQPGPDTMLNVPLPNITISVTPAAVTLHTPDHQPSAYSTGTPNATAIATIRDAGGMLAVVTHALNPDQLGDIELNRAMKSPSTLIGWAPLHS